MRFVAQHFLGPAALGIRVYISGRTLVPVLQLLNVVVYGEYYINLEVSCPGLEVVIHRYGE